MSDRDTEAPPPAEGGFLGRWSRRKQAAAAGEPLPELAPPAPAASTVPAAQAPEAAAPPLPDPETLDFTADFAAYLQARVPAAMKRAAMKKLFSDPAFNRMDGLDVYIEDFNRIGDLSAAEAGLLAHARDVLTPAPARRLSEWAAADDEQAAGAAPAVPVAAAPAEPAEPAEPAADVAAQDAGPQRIAPGAAPAPDAAASESVGDA